MGRKVIVGEGVGEAAEEQVFVYTYIYKRLIFYYSTVYQLILYYQLTQAQPQL